MTTAQPMRLMQAIATAMRVVMREITWKVSINK
jgi:hypothetical protein